MVKGLHTGIIALETHALLQRRLQDARTMNPFIEMFIVAESGQGPLGQELAGCISHCQPICRGLLWKTGNEKVPTRKTDKHFGS